MMQQSWCRIPDPLRAQHADLPVASPILPLPSTITASMNASVEDDRAFAQFKKRFLKIP
jgi:hypothetical protein